MYFFVVMGGTDNSVHSARDRAIADLMRLGLFALTMEKMSLSKIEFVLLRSLGKILAFVSYILSVIEGRLASHRIFSMGVVLKA